MTIWNSFNNKLVTILLAFTIYGWFVLPVSAQTPELPPGPIYIVQEGDTLWEIAYLFQVGVDEIVEYNNLLGLDIYVDDQLVIPGMEDLSGILSTHIVQFGESLRSISRQNRLDMNTIIDLNKIVTPSELYAGYKLIILIPDGNSTPAGRAAFNINETTLALALRQDIGIWEISQVNNLSGPTVAIPGDVYTIPGAPPSSSPVGFPVEIFSVSIDPLPIYQGDTVQIIMDVSSDTQPGGLLGNYELNFYSLESGSWVALQGIHAMEDPGIYPLQISISHGDSLTQVYEQMVLIKPGFFLEELLYVDQNLIDPVITEPENQWLLSVVTPASVEKLWHGVLQLPVAEDNYCLRSGFGNRRSYNAGELLSFHSGLDFGICSESHPFDIYTPADGIVIYVGEKTVRGNVTIINHGWGVYSGFWHQDEIFVNIGDFVTKGQPIGTIGSTGRVTGPHLHWELWVNGVQVDPLIWLEDEFPH